MPDTTPANSHSPGAIPAADNSAPDEQGTRSALELLLFRVQDTFACIPLRNVERILSLMALRPIPHAPPEIAGLMDLHQQGVPVLDLGLRLGLQHPQPYNTDTPVIVCADGGRQVGLVVDEIDGVLTSSWDALQQRAAFDQPSSGLYGVVPSPRGLALVLSAHAFMVVSLHHPETPPVEEPA